MNRQRSSIRVAAATFLLLPAVGNACLCVDFIPSALFDLAEHVFIGYVQSAAIERRPAKDEYPLKGEMAVTARVSVQETLKGLPETLDYLVTSVDADSCGVPMTPGQTYLFFVERSVLSGRMFWKKTLGIVSLCGGSTTDYGEIYSELVKSRGEKFR